MREQRSLTPLTHGAGADVRETEALRRSLGATLDCQASGRATLSEQDRPTPSRNALGHNGDRERERGRGERCTWSGTVSSSDARKRGARPTAEAGQGELRAGTHVRGDTTRRHGPKDANQETRKGRTGAERGGRGQAAAQRSGSKSARRARWIC